MKLVVAGAAGKIAFGTLLYLLEQEDVEQIVCTDIKEDKVKEVVAKLGDKRLVPKYNDFQDIKGTAEVFKGCDVVVNCGYQGYTSDEPYIDYALLAMEAALEAGVNYADLGGITPSEKILSKEFSDRFKKKNILAIPGMGEAPGLSQIMVAYAINRMDRPDSVDQFWAETDLVPPEEHSRPFHAAFTLGGLRSIVTVPTVSFEGGKIHHDPPMANQEVFTFREPLGTQVIAQTTGEPMLAVIRSFPDKGIKHASWKVGVDPILVFCRDIGLMSNEPIDVKGQKVVPWDFFAALIDNLPPETKKNPMWLVEGRQLVKGEEGGKQAEYEILQRPSIEALKKYTEKGATGEITTSICIGVAALMIGRGLTKEKGVLMPELSLSPEIFFDLYRKAGMEIEVNKKIVW